MSLHGQRGFMNRGVGADKGGRMNIGVANLGDGEGGQLLSFFGGLLQGRQALGNFLAVEGDPLRISLHRSQEQRARQLQTAGRFLNHKTALGRAFQQGAGVEGVFSGIERHRYFAVHLAHQALHHDIQTGRHFPDIKQDFPRLEKVGPQGCGHIFQFGFGQLVEGSQPGQK